MSKLKITLVGPKGCGKSTIKAQILAFCLMSGMFDQIDSEDNVPKDKIDQYHNAFPAGEGTRAVSIVCVQEEEECN
jgi:ABC-type cobalamin transport system ATPase subunit